MSSSSFHKPSNTTTVSKFFRRPSFLNDHHSLSTPHNPEFEFHESDLYTDSSSKMQHRKPKTFTMRRTSKVADASCRSVPVNIPRWSNRVGESEGSDEEEDENERVPPHEYLARKRGASLSVHEGVGRTLKGRDLSRVRNAVWKTIGFED